jgi:GT2 family glycosyltransferase
VLFLNPDAVLEPRAVEILVDFMERRPRAGIAAPALLGSTGKPHRAGGLITASRVVREALRLAVEERRPIEPGGAPFETTWLSGAVQLVRTRLLRELGGFDPRFFMYFEETDLEMRARESGWELWAVGEAVGHHSGAASARASGRKLIDYAIADEFFRSRFYYLVKHHGWASAVAAESADVLGSAVRASALAGGRDPSPPLARLRARSSGSRTSGSSLARGAGRRSGGSVDGPHRQGR